MSHSPQTISIPPERKETTTEDALQGDEPRAKLKRNWSEQMMSAMLHIGEGKGGSFVGCGWRVVVFKDI